MQVRNLITIYNDYKEKYFTLAHWKKMLNCMMNAHPIPSTTTSVTPLYKDTKRNKKMQEFSHVQPPQ